MQFSPRYIIPLLVEQPTWGGEYIAEFKGISDPAVTTKKIGQLYELFSGSQLTSQPSWSYAMAPASQIDQPSYSHKPADIHSLQSLIDQDPVQVLGEKAIAKNDNALNVLIKFTQAQNNSYQVHVRPGNEFGKWKPKPESWYFLEPGKATLGLRENCDVAEYKKRCIEIESFAQQLSQEVVTGQKNVTKAREELQAFINQDHPARFVNTLAIPKDQVIDLSEGGVHHSWEMSPEIPLGNIVYEVQCDVMDEYSSLRSFDQGNIKDDGKVRTLTIEDYFTSLDTRPEVNAPARYFQTPPVKLDGSASIQTLFENQYYTTLAIQLSSSYQGAYTETAGSWHHLFVQEGEVSVVCNGEKWKLSKGWSLFVPACVGSYALETSEHAVVLCTSV